MTRLVTLCALVGLAIVALAYTAAPRAEAPARVPARVEAPGGQYRPAVAFGGTNSLSVWEDQRLGFTASGTRISPGGTILDPEQIWFAGGPGTEIQPDVAFDGENYLSVWLDARITGFSEVYASRIGQDGVVLDPNGIALSRGGCCRFAPAVAFGGGEYLAVWSHPGAFTDIRGTRVTTAGEVLDSTGLPISIGPSWHWDPAVASDGADFFVVWE